MNRTLFSLVLALALALAVPVSWAGEIESFSVSANLAAKAMNSDNTEGVQGRRIDDGAYGINLSYNIDIDRSPGDSLGRRFEYFGLRLFQWKSAYSEGASTAVNEGVYGVKGVAAVYGRRYFVSRDSYNGMAFGLYGGLASMKQQWAVFGSELMEATSYTPIAGTEVLYRVDVWQNIYVEPSVSFSYWKTKAGSFLTQVVFNLGADF